ncbi:CATRA system-associated protein [Streptosporangium longisporum]
MPDPRTIVAELTELLTWRLPPASWPRVATALDNLVRTLPDGPVEPALDDLTYLGPERLRVRLGDDPSVPPPEEVRERINRLIRDLEPDIDRAAD